MEDFIRLNLNSLIGGFGFVLILSLAYFYVITVKVADKQIKRYVTYVFLAAVCIILFASVLSITHQLSVNQLPKSTIDKSYLDEKQDSYKTRVLKESETK